MRDEHITGILENAPLGRLGEGELAAVRAHAARCAECLRAYEAAQLASLLLSERVAVETEMPPFFQTRVLAALRERRAGEEIPALRRLWRAAGALVTSMGATVALLAALTFAVPGFRPSAADTQDEVSASDPYTAEATLVAQDETAAAGDEVDYEQVFAAVYGSEEDAGGDDE